MIALLKELARLRVSASLSPEQVQGLVDELDRLRIENALLRAEFEESRRTPSVPVRGVVGEVDRG